MRRIKKKYPLLCIYLINPESDPRIESGKTKKPTESVGSQIRRLFGKSGRGAFQQFNGASLLGRRFLPLPETEIPLSKKALQRNFVVLQLKVGGQNFSEAVKREIVILLELPAAGQETFEHFRPIITPDQQPAEIKEIVPKTFRSAREKFLHHLGSRQPPRTPWA
jgi:hypothetical protein